MSFLRGLLKLYSERFSSRRSDQAYPAYKAPPEQPPEPHMWPEGLRPYEMLQHLWAWKGDDIRVVQPGEDRVALLESRYGVRLPEGFREYLLRSAPAAPTKGAVQMDFEATTWWEIDRIKSIAEECGPPGRDQSLTRNEAEYLIFADHLIWCGAWAIACGTENRGRILFVGGVDDFVADSFAEFVDRYARDTDSFVRGCYRRG